MKRIAKHSNGLRTQDERALFHLSPPAIPILQRRLRSCLTLAEMRCGYHRTRRSVFRSDGRRADDPGARRSEHWRTASRLPTSSIWLRRFENETDVPIVLFSYLNPLFRYGFERLAEDAADAGIDGVLVTDAVDEEAAEISAILRRSRYRSDLADRTNDNRRTSRQDRRECTADLFTPFRGPA